MEKNEEKKILLIGQYRVKTKKKKKLFQMKAVLHNKVS